MFNDLQMATYRLPRPASRARLRAMARQLARRDAEELHEAWDPEATDTVADLVKSTRSLSKGDRGALRDLLVEVAARPQGGE